MYGLGIGPREDLVGPVHEHHRRDGPELLAALDLVEPLEVLGVAGMGQQEPVTQRPRPELAPPVEPATTPLAARMSATSPPGRRGGERAPPPAQRCGQLVVRTSRDRERQS